MCWKYLVHLYTSNSTQVPCLCSFFLSVYRDCIFSLRFYSRYLSRFKCLFCSYSLEIILCVIWHSCAPIIEDSWSWLWTYCMFFNHLFRNMKYARKTNWQHEYFWHVTKSYIVKGISIWLKISILLYFLEISNPIFFLKFWYILTSWNKLQLRIKFDILIIFNYQGKTWFLKIESLKTWIKKVKCK